MQPFPHPSDATYKIWSWFKIGQLASEIFKFESVDDDGPLVFYKLTLSAFGSSELKKGGKMKLPEAAIFHNTDINKLYLTISILNL